MPEFLGKRKRKDSWANSSVPERKEPKYGELKGDEEDRGKSREAQGLPRSGPHKTASCRSYRKETTGTKTTFSLQCLGSRVPICEQAEPQSSQSK